MSMVDRHLQQLRREQAADLASQARLLWERVRVGELSEARLRSFGTLAHPAATHALGLEPPPPGSVAAGLSYLNAAARESLLEAAVWAAECLESEILAGIGRLRPAAAAPSRHPWSDHDPAGLVTEVVRARRDLVRHSGGWIHDFAPEALPGRLVGYDPELSLFDGATNAGSGGFFDDYDCPPWSTWVAYVDKQVLLDGEGWGPFIVAWVPPALVDSVAVGLRCEAGWSLNWLDDLP